MKGTGQRYVRTIFTRDGNFTLEEDWRGDLEEITGVEYAAETAGWYVTVCGYGHRPPEPSASDE